MILVTLLLFKESPFVLTLIAILSIKVIQYQQLIGKIITEPRVFIVLQEPGKFKSEMT